MSAIVEEITKDTKEILQEILQHYTHTYITISPYIDIQQ